MFDIPKAVVERVLGTLTRVDDMLAQYELLARETRALVAKVDARVDELDRLRQAVQVALGKAE